MACPSLSSGLMRPNFSFVAQGQLLCVFRRFRHTQPSQLECTAACNSNIRPRLTELRPKTRHLSDNIHAVGYFSKHYVFTIQPWSLTLNTKHSEREFPEKRH